MWFLVSVVKGSRHYEPDSPIGNRVLICDTSELVISGRASYSNSYRFEGRIGNESYVVGEFSGTPTPELLLGKFLAMAKQMGAVTAGAEPAAA
jgi:hypothetical protein